LQELRNAKKILIPRFDSHGDIILLSGFLRSLLDVLPDAEVTILVREGHEQLAPLLPSKIKWLTTKIFPYKPFAFEDVVELNHLLSIIDKGSWDVLLTTCYTRTWLDFVIAARLIDATSYAIGEFKPVIDWIKLLFQSLSLSEDKLWDHYVEVEESSHEIDKYTIFFSYIFNFDYSISLPSIDINNEDNSKANELIKDIGLVPGNYFICLPAGTHNISIKCWPPDRFVELVLQIHSEMCLTPLLVGHELEIDVLNYVANKVMGAGCKVSVWVGKSGELHCLAAIMQEAKFYVGNDSGPMHMAAAIGIPTIGIFGGGYWPRFLPVGPHSVGVAGILPCFGCDWDCTFEDAPCVKTIQVSHVLETLKSVLHGNEFKGNMLLVQHLLSHDAIEYITKAHNQYSNCKASRSKLAYNNACLTVTSSVSNPIKNQIHPMLQKLLNLFTKTK